MFFNGWPLSRRVSNSKRIIVRIYNRKRSFHKRGIFCAFFLFEAITNFLIDVFEMFFERKIAIKIDS